MKPQHLTNQLISSVSLASLIVIIFVSCQRDPISIINDPNIHTPDYYSGSLSGQVIDEDLEPLEGVTVKINTVETTTDRNGFFTLSDIQLDINGTLVKSEKDGYWSISKMLSPSKDQINYTKILLKEKKSPEMIDSELGGRVSFLDEIKLDFPQDAFVTSDGERYTGIVSVSAVYLDPSDPNFGIVSPGDFRAFNTESELQTLVSLGMAGVELNGANNEVLEVNSDKKVTLSIKVPANATEEEVPLWHFDEESGYWLEEGIAQRNGDYFEGEVSHFSWWNCDIPFSAVKLSGTILSPNGGGVTGLPVTVFLADNMRNLGTEFTGERGFFCGMIPINQTLILQLTDECGLIYFQEEIGPFSEDVSLPAITSTTQNLIEVCGSLANCDSERVTYGYVVVDVGNNLSLLPLDSEGRFCSSVNVCDAESFDIYGIDLETGLQGFASNYELSDSPLSDLELKACDQVANIFRYTIENEPEIVITEFGMSWDDNVLGWGSNEEIYGGYPGVILDGQNWGTDDFSIGFKGVHLYSPTSEVECDFDWCTNFVVDVVEFNGEGNPIILNITGYDDLYSEKNFSIYFSTILE